MFTVIVPTLWRASEIFQNSLSALVDHVLVGEIIIIDNDATNRPNWVSEFALIEKVKLLNFGKNIYVNPAWNVGVTISNFDKICLLNDDIIFDTKIFNFLYDKLSENDGLIGLHKSCFYSSPREEIVLERADHIEYAFGCLLFFNKHNFIHIPNKFQIWCGDNWLFTTHVKANKFPRKIYNLSVWGSVEVSSSSNEFDIVKQMDLNAEQEFLQK